MLQVDGLSRSYGAIRAAEDVSFNVEAGEVHGLCGHNGAGKSTVVKMLSGLIYPDSGRLLLDGREVAFTSVRDGQSHGIALVDQELSVVPALTVLENLVLGNIDQPFLRRRGSGRARARDLLDTVGLTDLDPLDEVETLSLGQRQLLEIARALGREANVLILDEPTATLSSVDIEHVFTAIRRVTETGRGVIYVSHRLDEVMELCARVTVMRDGRVVGTADRKELTGGSLVEMMLGEAVAHGARSVSPDHNNEVRLEVEGLSAGRRTQGVEFEARAGTIYALAGQIGSGTTDVLRALGGLDPQAHGRVAVDGQVVPLGSPRESQRAGIAYVPGDRKSEGLFLGQSIEQNLNATNLDRLSRWGFLMITKLKAAAHRMSDAIGLDPKRVGEPAERLSGGNQQKVLIGRCLEQEGIDVLLLDDPTRGVDVRGRADIHELVHEFARDGAAVVFSSTELGEILDLADVVIAMRGGKVVSQNVRADVDGHHILSDMTHTPGASS
ncbi:MAG: sugar ABC transporter ATP-binding protein [Thermoleophilia bacterium]|nr:sugar ABC transporter ATP-binding protein [Thermoleophilia bacterium]